MRRSFAALSAGVALFAAAPAHAQAARGESSVPGRLVVRNQCLMTNLTEAVTEQRQQDEALPALVAPIIAAFGGELAKTVLGGIASAIESASQEHAYTARGADGFFVGSVVRDGASGSWRLDRKPKCLIFHVPDDSDQSSGIAVFVQEAVATGLSTAEESGTLTGRVRGVGITKAPLAYIEIALIPHGEALVVRPLLVWYRKPIASAGTSPRRAEINLTLASPSYAKDGDELGSIFALSRIPLPRIRPGPPQKKDDLAGIATIYHLNRPTTGSIDDTVAQRNAVEAAVATATLQQTLATRAHDAAKLKADASKKPEDRAAEVAAKFALDDANVALATAKAKQAGLQGANATPTVGATNARVSFLVIRDANKFGLAIAKALGAQQQAVGTAVTQALTSQPDWEPTDTAFLTAMLEVQTKQAAYDAAVAESDATKLLAARNALLIAKAKANEAAVAVNKEPPYPGVLGEGGA